MEYRGNIVMTGAAGAIGRAMAKLLYAEGYRLLLVDRDAGALEVLAAECPGSTSHVAQASDATQMAAVFAAAGSLDAVILAAGIEGPVGVLEDCAEDAFDEVLRVNVKGVWLGMKFALPLMKAQRRGSIVALSSISGVMAAPLLAPYAASKHAVVGLVRSAAREAAAHNVRVNALCPAPVDSQMMTRIDAGLAAAAPGRAETDAAKRVPMQRYARTEEVARAAVFLCSDASSYCNGSTFMVDGAITCR
jgi:NAD(P)-dependent dehydrogenase (short-subunit alcohol dehydrogenase family)